MKLKWTKRGPYFIAMSLLGLVAHGCSDDTSDSAAATTTSTAVTTGTGGSVGSGGMGGGGEGGSAPACTIGDTQCEGGLVSTCAEVNGVAQWDEAEQCTTDFICKVDGCQEASATQKAQGQVLYGYADDLRDFTGYDLELDFEALKAQATLTLYLGDGSDYFFAKAAFGLFRAVPHGHGAIGFGPLDYSECFDPAGVAPLRGSSWYGVCARSAGDASIVTFADPQNPLGLSPGDRVIRIIRDGENWEGAELLDRVGQEPVCDGGLPSDSGTRRLQRLACVCHY